MPAEHNIAMLGAGSWGTALGIMLASKQYEVRLWGHLADEIAHMTQERENRFYLPGISFPTSLHPTSSLSMALTDADLVVIAVPSHAFRSVIIMLKDQFSAETGLVWATKGVEPGTHRLLSDIVTEHMPDHNLAVISGPTFAGEVARRLPTAITVASPNQRYAESVADILRSHWFRAYTSNDLIGVQVGGATKNVMAIAAGIADGLGFGANTRAALITRGLHEIMQLGLRMGGRPETFMGLAGLGDLILTCTDDQSRNRRMGLALAAGHTVEQAKISIGQEVEGIQTAREIHAMMQASGVEMPISYQVHQVLFEGLAPKTAVENLLDRKQKPEI